MSSKSKFLLTVLAVILLSLSLPSLVKAGGWAVVTLDRLPGEVIAGQPYALGFMARQHGRTPWQVPEIRIQARQPETGQALTFIAKPDGQAGHYQAELLFPQPGRWEWGIETGLFPQAQPMPALTVAGGAAGSADSAAVSAASNASSSAADSTSGAGAVRLPGAPALLSGLLAVLALAGGVALLARGRAKPLRMWAGTGLLVLCAGLAFAAGTFASGASANAESAQLPLTAQDPPPAAAASSAETGRQLFLAKGCVVCHVNTRAVENAAEYSVAAGPDLSAYPKNDPAYLKPFLANPQAVKTTSEMPNLGLTAEEIDALVSFVIQ